MSEFDPNKCHPHVERWEKAITHTETEFRRELWEAFQEGGSLQEPSEHDFNRWFRERYGTE